MQRSTKVLACLAIAAGSVVLADAQPASAAVTPTVSGTVITVAMTGDGSVFFGCNGSAKVTVNAFVTSPQLACGSLTKVVVNGDDDDQTIRADFLTTVTAFTANPFVQANTNGGSDKLYDTDVADSFALGPGNDQVFLMRGLTNSLTDLGTGAADSVVFNGVASNETISLGSTNTNLTIADQVSGVTRTQTALNGESLIANGFGGNDTISATGITSASSISSISLVGGEGNDVLNAGTEEAFLYGGTGANTLNGGIGDDYINSESEDDTVNAGSGTNTIVDSKSLHSGGRTVSNTGATNSYTAFLGGGDVMVRVRAPVPTSMAFTASLNRNGQQTVGNTYASLGFSLGSAGDIDDRAIADIFAPGSGRTISATADGHDNDLADVTITEGSWSTSGTIESSMTITTSSPALGNVTVSKFGELSLHAPWPNDNESFVHRVTRDLVFRFPAGAVRTLTAGQLTAGTKTRPQLIAELMNTDEYRGIDVDRTYVKFLRRVSDPGGRASWITSLENGKSLTKFRAQLVGSSEYFNNAGGTNAKYMVQAYADVMGRAPDAGGQTYWTNKLNNGADRGAVAREFMSSTEARRNVVKDQFLRFLDRYPTTPEADLWVSNLAASNGEQSLIAFLAASGTYHTKD